jgi:hypothetical protein
LTKAIEKVIQNKKNSSKSVTKSEKSQDTAGKIETVTQSRHIELWHDENQCQAMTTSGTRCKNRGSAHKQYITGKDGSRYEFLVCQRHNDWKAKPCPSAFQNHQKKLQS